MRTFVAASLVVVFANAVAKADEFSAFITTFEDGTMTVKKLKGTEKPEDVTAAVLQEMRDNPRRGFDPLLVKALITANDTCGVAAVNVSHVDTTSGCVTTISPRR